MCDFLLVLNIKPSHIFYGHFYRFRDNKLRMPEIAGYTHPILVASVRVIDWNWRVIFDNQHS